jgi:anti-sigma regulatory factor (Ser/Thr protein kinase)
VSAPELQVQLAGPYPTAGLDRLLSDLAPLDALTSPTLVVVDLRLLGRISARSAAVLAATLLDVAARGVLREGSLLRPPSDPHVRRRLDDLEMLDLLAGRSASDDLERGRARGSRPCQLFTATEDPGVVAQSLTSAIVEVCDADEPAQSAIWFALNEIAQNVADHADARGGAVGIAEVTRAGTELEVSIADHGIGIRASLERNPSHDIDSDLDALRVAISPGRSGRPNRPGPVGLGLYLTRLMLRDNDGALIVRSGGAQIEVGASSSKAFSLTPMRGTLVTLRFRTDHPVSLDSLLGGC